MSQHCYAKDTSHPSIYDFSTTAVDGQNIVISYPAYPGYPPTPQQTPDPGAIYNNWDISANDLWFDIKMPVGGQFTKLRIQVYTYNIIPTASGNMVQSVGANDRGTCDATFAPTQYNNNLYCFGYITATMAPLLSLSTPVATGKAYVDYETSGETGVGLSQDIYFFDDALGVPPVVTMGDTYRFTLHWTPASPTGKVWISRRQWTKDYNCYVVQNGCWNIVDVDPSQTDKYHLSNANVGCDDPTRWTYPPLQYWIIPNPGDEATAWAQNCGYTLLPPEYAGWSPWYTLEPIQEHNGTGVQDVNTQRGCANAGTDPATIAKCTMQSMYHGYNCGDGPTVGQLQMRTCTVLPGQKNCLGWNNPIRFPLSDSPLPVDQSQDPSWFAKGGIFPYSEMDFTQTVPPAWIEGVTLQSNGGMLGQQYLTETVEDPIVFADYIFTPGTAPSCVAWTGECVPQDGYCDTRAGQPWMGTQTGQSPIDGPTTRQCQVTDSSGNPTNCPIDGGYGDWGSWSKCVGGNQIRMRPCNNPYPQYNGKSCLAQDIGPSYQTRTCVDCEGFTGRRAEVSNVWILILVLVIVLAMFVTGCNLVPGTKVVSYKR